LESPHQSLHAHSLRARPVSYEYRYCPRCRQERPAKYQSCPECVHWLGDRPLERTEWQLAPEQRICTASGRYELIGACALVLRIVRDRPPASEQIVELNGIICKMLAVAGCAARGIGDQGWLIWTKEGLRRAFRLGFELERQLIALLPTLEKILCHSGSKHAGVRRYLASEEETTAAERGLLLVVGRQQVNFMPSARIVPGPRKRPAK
jgi:hypothetical protein